MSRGSSCTRRRISYLWLALYRAPRGARHQGARERMRSEIVRGRLRLGRQLPHAMGMPRSRRAHAHTASRTRRGTWDDATTVDGGHRRHLYGGSFLHSPHLCGRTGLWGVGAQRSLDLCVVEISVQTAISTMNQSAIWHICHIVSLGRRGAPRGCPCGGEMGSHGPPQAPIFSAFFFFSRFLLVFMGILRTCGHAITPCDSLSALLTVP